MCAPYSKGQKNDFRDAEAIAEAVQQPTMKFVATKTIDQLDLQALHRVRERLVSRRTGIVNQIHGFMLERGIAVRQGSFTRRCLSQTPGRFCPETQNANILIALGRRGDYARNRGLSHGSQRLKARSLGHALAPLSRALDGRSDGQRIPGVPMVLCWRMTMASRMVQSPPPTARRISKLIARLPEFVELERGLGTRPFCCLSRIVSHRSPAI
jgi:hypothetical protein